MYFHYYIAFFFIFLAVFQGLQICRKASERKLVVVFFFVTSCLYDFLPALMLMEISKIDNSDALWSMIGGWERRERD